MNPETMENLVPATKGMKVGVAVETMMVIGS